MKNPRLYSLAFLALSFSVLTTAGCLRSPDPRFFALNSLSNPQSAKPASATTSRLVVSVGPVTLPEYTNRPQIVIHLSANELKIDDFNRWAEPLDRTVPQVIADNLAILIPTESVFVFPLSGPVATDYQVTIDITRFTAEADGMGSLIARWSILGKNGDEVLLSRKSAFSEPGMMNNYAGTVAAMNRMLEKLSREIATAIRSLLGRSDRTAP